ncbi:MAG: PHP domain-containing protein [Patescibacteria group bacterium]|jgi:DNA polymerase III alpha subunit
MKVKASLHIHTAEDVLEGRHIFYNIYQLIDAAKKLDFKILALTGHEHFIYRSEYGAYAKKNGILLIPGIELTVISKSHKKNHVVVLNCGPDIESIKTFPDLENYKRNHLDIFIIAPHPNFHLGVSLGLKNLEKYIELFDAIEHSWFYTKWFNLNIAVAKIAQKYHRPLVATSDLHQLAYLDRDYALIESADLDIKNVLSALSQNNFVNVTKAKTWRELLPDSLNLL